MAKGFVGKKLGCTQLWSDEQYVMVTVVQVEPNVVIKQKTVETDGYKAIKIGYGEIKPEKVNRPLSGEYNKAAQPVHRYMMEFRDMEAEVGTKLDVTQFAAGEKVAVKGTSRGLGFQGVMKRHHFGGDYDTHGAMSHRRPGSIGNRLTPGHVNKGMRMGGHMGQDTVKVKNLHVVKVDAERGLLLLKGAIPGPRGAKVVVTDK